MGGDCLGDREGSCWLCIWSCPARVHDCLSGGVKEGAWDCRGCPARHASTVPGKNQNFGNLATISFACQATQELCCLCWCHKTRLPPPRKNGPLLMDEQQRTASKGVQQLEIWQTIAERPIPKHLLASCRAGLKVPKQETRMSAEQAQRLCGCDNEHFGRLPVLAGPLVHQLGPAGEHQAFLV